MCHENLAQELGVRFIKSLVVFEVLEIPIENGSACAQTSRCYKNQATCFDVKLLEKQKGGTQRNWK